MDSQDVIQCHRFSLSHIQMVPKAGYLQKVLKPALGLWVL
jgi:hypothetical protein